MSPHVTFNGEETPMEMPLPPAAAELDFTVESIETNPSKSGKEMLTAVLRLSIPGDACDGDRIRDYFTEPSVNKKTQVALKRFCSAVGVGVGAGGLDTEECIGKSGKVVLKKDEYLGKESRRIADYVL